MGSKRRLARSQAATAAPDKPEYVAIHEAGHAVFAVVNCLNLGSVDVKRRYLANGQVSAGFTNTKVTVPEFLGDKERVGRLQIIAAFVGVAAEARLNPNAQNENGWHQDFADARRIAAMVVCDYERVGNKMTIQPPELKRKDAQIQAMIKEGISEADNFVTLHWSTIVAVAKELLTRKSLSGDVVREIVASQATPEALVS